MVGFVRWCPNYPRIQEILSGGAGIDGGMECGISERNATTHRVDSSVTLCIDHLGIAPLHRSRCGQVARTSLHR